MKNKPRKILVCALDWGIGHITRMIPIIKLLKNEGYHVSFAAGKKSIDILKKEFTDVETFKLPTVSPIYSKKAFLFFPFLLFQAPLFLVKTYKERRQIQTIVKNNNIDVILNDNRFGSYSKAIPSYYFTHQVKIQLPTNLKWTEWFVNYMHHRIIRRHQHCFVIDNDVPDNLAGELSIIPDRRLFTHVGISSRFVALPKMRSNKVLIVLSGQEPQRSLLESELLQQVCSINEEVVFVRGVKPSARLPHCNKKNLHLINFATSAELIELFKDCKIVVCRSGYSSIMDLVALQKKAFLIPTPGQSEQEHIAQFVSTKGWFHSQKQNKIVLKEDLALALQQSPPNFIPNVRLKIVLDKIREICKDDEE